MVEMSLAVYIGHIKLAGITIDLNELVMKSISLTSLGLHESQNELSNISSYPCLRKKLKKAYKSKAFDLGLLS